MRTKILKWWKETLIALGILGVAAAAPLGGQTDIDKIQSLQDKYYEKHGEYAQVIKGNKVPSDAPFESIENALGQKIHNDYEVHIYETAKGDGYQIIKRTENRVQSWGFGVESESRTYDMEIEQL